MSCAAVAAAPGDTQGISAKFAAAYAKHRIGEVFSFEMPVAAPRADVRFTGKVYLLVNRHSYSNTVQVAALPRGARVEIDAMAFAPGSRLKRPS